jgi:hypothetical protein
VELKAVAEILSRSKVLCMHQGPVFRASISGVVGDAAWQAITYWSRHNKDELQNSVHCLLPQREKDKFKASGVKKDVPKMDMLPH